MPAVPSPGLLWVGIRMLLAAQSKCWGIIAGIALCTLLVCQQLSIFWGLLDRASWLVRDTAQADLWVMAPSTSSLLPMQSLPSTAISRVRAVAGIEWAVPLSVYASRIHTDGGVVESATVVAFDEKSFVGVPNAFLLGTADSLRSTDNVAVTVVGYAILFPNQSLRLGDTAEINDHRVRIAAIVDAPPAFRSNLVIYSRRDLAMQMMPSHRSELGFVLAKVDEGVFAPSKATQVASLTGYKVTTAAAFKAEVTDTLISKTGIPFSIGMVVALGAITGITIVGLTFG
ncbi:MAG: ABC transporter permease, partial [Planctomycetota bacterium]